MTEVMEAAPRGATPGLAHYDESAFLDRHPAVSGSSYQEEVSPPAEEELSIEELTRLNSENLASMRDASLRQADLVLDHIEAQIAADPNPQARRRLEKRLLEVRAVQAALSTDPGQQIELSFAITCQPSPHQMGLPGRPLVLVKKARRRLAKSGLAHADLGEVMGSVGVLVGEEAGVTVCHRLLHFIAHGNLDAYGLALTRALRRIVNAAKSQLRDSDDDYKLSRETRQGLFGFLAACESAR